jgi:rRNA maturation RNase YbeY
MLNSNINFFSENISFVLKNKKMIRKWIFFAIDKEKKYSGIINYIFCNDARLLSLNKTYLNRDTLTDILTFDYSEDNKISGDIFISIDRVKKNAKTFNVLFFNELQRIMIHGILHLIGYNDKTDKEKIVMTQKEDYYLSLFYKNFM